MHYNKEFKKPNEWLDALGFEYIDKGKELIIRCPFSDCDKHKRPSHLYMNGRSGAYYCHKCGERGGSILRFIYSTGKSGEAFSYKIKDTVRFIDSMNRRRRHDC